MADVKPLKLVDQGAGVGRLAEFESGDTLPKAALPALSAADVGAVAADDPRLSDAREWIAGTVSQTEAEAGTATTRRAWTALRVRQAIVAWWNSVSSAWGRGFVASADAAAGRTALNCANKSGDTYSGVHEYFNSSLRFAGDQPSQIGDYGEIKAAPAGGLALNAVGTIAGGLTVILFDGQTPTGTEEFSVRFFRNLNTSGSAKFTFFKGNGTAQAQHEFDGKGLVNLNRFDGETVIGTGVSNGVDKLQVAGTIIATGAIKLAEFTLETLPSAAANARGQVYVSDLAGQPGPCFSDGTNWRRVSDNTIAN